MVITLKDSRIRNLIESLYEGTCNIVEYQKVKDPVTKKTTFGEVTVHEDVPCKLSFSTQRVTGSDNVASMQEIIKLFLSPDIEVKAGSKIVVTQRGRVVEYSNASAPSVFNNHQEITLETFKGWS